MHFRFKRVDQIDTYKKSCEDALRVKDQPNISEVFDQALNVFFLADGYLRCVKETLRDFSERFVIKAVVFES